MASICLKENNYGFLGKKYDAGVVGCHLPTWYYYRTWR